MKIKKALISIFLVCLILSLFNGGVMAEKDEAIVLGEPDWPGIWAKNAIANEILTTLGYEIEIRSVGDMIIHQSVGEGEIDVHLGSWMPATENVRNKIDGKFDLVSTNLDKGLYTLGVPEFVWEAGVRSFGDLNKYADKFDHKLYLGPVGWPISDVFEKAIKNDTYNLGDWEIVNSSITAMITNMKKAQNEGNWIVTLAWKPHWMNYLMDIKYLEDPKNIWKSAESRVDTITRLGFKDDYPEVYKFLQQFKVNNEMSNKWIYKIGHQEEEPKIVARNWIENNIDQVEEWLKGVKARDGQSAIEKIKEEY